MSIDPTVQQQGQQPTVPPTVPTEQTGQAPAGQNVSVNEAPLPGQQKAEDQASNISQAKPDAPAVQPNASQDVPDPKSAEKVAEAAEAAKVAGQNPVEENPRAAAAVPPTVPPVDTEAKAEATEPKKEEAKAEATEPKKPGFFKRSWNNFLNLLDTVFCDWIGGLFSNDAKKSAKDRVAARKAQNEGKVVEPKTEEKVEEKKPEADKKVEGQNTESDKKVEEKKPEANEGEEKKPEADAPKA